MAKCRFYRGNNCCGCKCFYKSNSVTLTGGNVIINIPAHTFKSKERACICIAQAIPAGVTSASLVYITIGASATQYMLMTKCGNSVRGDQIRSRKVYHTHVTTDPGSFVLCDTCLCDTTFVYPTIPPAAAPSQVSISEEMPVVENIVEPVSKASSKSTSGK